MVQAYRLSITHFQQQCLFTLTWGDGLQCTAEIPYQEELVERYDRWQRVYFDYYCALNKNDQTDSKFETDSGLRGRIGAVGQLPVEQDLRSQLAQAEVKLLTAFQRWLESRDLIKIRRQLSTRTDDNNSDPITLYINCSTMALQRLPWETWKLTTEFGQAPPIRIVRQPVNVLVESNPPRKKRRKARALVIIGDGKGLNFDSDRNTLQRLDKLIEAEVIGWHRGKNPHQLVDEIRNGLRDPVGWDLLFFFGHSNEATDLGGEIAIAPNTTLFIRDIEADLIEAKRNGLQFALFNSCTGLNIADRLVALGLNQVVIMREPIHNQVAQYFLLQFLQQLAQYNNVHTALQNAATALQVEKNMAYPSAYLVPSLFSHRGAELFQLYPMGWKAKLAELLPSRRQGMVLGTIAILSLLPFVQDRLLTQRVWFQAMVHHVTRTLPTQPDPPVLLVHIDDESINRGIPNGKTNPMDRSYLAQLLNQVIALEGQVIGIDYLLDRHKDENNPTLATAIQTATERGRWLVLASWLFEGDEKSPTPEIFNSDWSMEGYINAPDLYLKALQLGQDCTGRCPFGYLLAMIQASRSREQLFTPSTQRTTDLRQQLLESIAQEQDNDPFLKELYHYRLSPIMTASRLIKQRWLQPILDFSIPPSHVYDRLPAHDLLEKDRTTLQNRYDWENQVVLIGAGGYGDAGIDIWSDYVENPPAIQFWRNQAQDSASRFTGVESHAYTIHHLLTRHRVVPLPTLWMVGVGTLIGAMSAMALQRDKRLQRYRWLGLSVFSGLYGVIGIMMYTTVSIVLPWLLPIAAVWVYHLPSLQGSNQGEI